MLFADVLSLHLVTFLMFFFILVTFQAGFYLGVEAVVGTGPGGITYSLLEGVLGRASPENLSILSLLRVVLKYSETVSGS